MALTYVGAIDDPARFSCRSRSAPVGLTPRGINRDSLITPDGQQDRRCLVARGAYQAAHVMLTKPVKGCSALEGWAMRIARRAGMRRAKVALARSSP